MAISGSILPSSYYIARTLQVYLASHRFFYATPVYNPATSQPLPVQRWRLYEGFPLETDTFYCTISPYSMLRSGAPLATSASAVYAPFNLGKEGYEEVTFYTKIAFDYLAPAVPGDNIDKYTIPLRRVWEDLKYHPDPTVMLTGWAETSVEYNPYIEAISEYLELTRLCIDDAPQQAFHLPAMRVHTLHCTHNGLITGNWEQGKNIILHSGYVMVQTVAYVARQWREYAPPKDLKLALNSPPVAGTSVS